MELLIFTTKVWMLKGDDIPQIERESHIDIQFEFMITSCFQRNKNQLCFYYIGIARSIPCKGCPKNSIECGDHSFCISAYDICDGEPECHNGWDESNCSTCLDKAGRTHKCPGLVSTKCLPVSSICDCISNCPNSTDEKGCPLLGCRDSGNVFAGYIACLYTTQNIHKYQVCDGKSDCTDGEDEIQCGRCNHGQYKCLGNNTKCIGLTDLCDGVNHCPGGSDESMCEQSPDPIFKPNKCLNTSKYIPNYHICNGKSDCLYGDDGENCDQCPSNQWKCPGNNSKCINIANRCDGSKDCFDGLDEVGCEVCPDGMFKCDGKCKMNKLVCNGVYNCKDKSDEAQCSADDSCQLVKISLYKVYLKGRRCPGEYKCIYEEKFCNGFPDCPQKTDEVECTCETRKGMVTCPGADCSEHACIPAVWVCDGHPDCPGGSEEISCPLESCNTSATCKDSCTNHNIKCLLKQSQLSEQGELL